MGPYTVSASGLTSSDYGISYVDGELTITAAVLTAVPTADSKVYDGTTVAVVSGGSVTGPIVLEIGRAHV